jgi:hypothetical protein
MKKPHKISGQSATHVKNSRAAMELGGEGYRCVCVCLLVLP